jgi:predicted DNA-binding transcriptional regulator AlpA
MLEGFVTLKEVADMAGLTVATAYQYRNKGQYDFPEHNLRVGQILFWKRATAAAWARKHKKRSRR